MIQLRSRLDVADNSGARMATMIGVVGKATMEARVGDIITANIWESSHVVHAAPSLILTSWKLNMLLRAFLLQFLLISVANSSMTKMVFRQRKLRRFKVN